MTTTLIIALIAALVGSFPFCLYVYLSHRENMTALGKVDRDQVPKVMRVIVKSRKWPWRLRRRPRRIPP